MSSNWCCFYFRMFAIFQFQLVASLIGVTEWRHLGKMDKEIWSQKKLFYNIDKQFFFCSSCENTPLLPLYLKWYEQIWKTFVKLFKCLCIEFFLIFFFTLLYLYITLLWWFKVEFEFEKNVNNNSRSKNNNPDKNSRDVNCIQIENVIFVSHQICIYN